MGSAVMHRRLVLGALLVSGCTDDASMDDTASGSTGGATVATTGPGSSTTAAGGLTSSSSLETDASTEGGSEPVSGSGAQIETASSSAGSDDESSAGDGTSGFDGASGTNESDGSESDSGGSVSPEDPAIWVVGTRPSLSIINVNDPSQRFTGLRPSNEPVQEPQLNPWSDEGDWLAQDRDGKLRIYDLRRGGLQVAEVPHTESWEIVGWAYRHGVVVLEEDDAGEDVFLITPEGGQHVLLRLGPDEDFKAPSISYNGEILVYTRRSGTTHDLWFVDFFDPTAPTAPELLLADLPSALLDPKWTLDSRWLAFGLASHGSMAEGVYLWNRAQGQAPTRVAPDDAEYAEHYSFSPQRHDFMRFGTSPAGDSFITHVRLDDTILRVSEFSSGEEQSPAKWSSDGGYVTYSDSTEGWLRAIYRTDLGRPIAIPGYRYSCPLAWASPTEFVYRACAGEAQGELFWGVAASPLPVEPVALGFRDTPFLTGGGCLALWEDTQLFVGAAAADPDLTSVASPMPAIDEVALDPRGAGLAWVTRQGFSYWQPLLECEPDGPPQALDRDGVLQGTLSFLPR